MQNSRQQLTPTSATAEADAVKIPAFKTVAIGPIESFWLRHQTGIQLTGLLLMLYSALHSDVPWIR